jgi:hypothetical protein
LIDINAKLVADAAHVKSEELLASIAHHFNALLVGQGLLKRNSRLAHCHEFGVAVA